MQYDEYSKRKSWKLGIPLQHWVSRTIAKQILNFYPEGLSVLKIVEVGSGTGTLGVELRKLGLYHYFAIEPNIALAKQTLNANTDAKIYNTSLPSIPLELKNSLDAVICVHVIEHAENGYQARDWIAACAEMLKPSGKIFIISPDIGDYKTFFWEIDWSHCFPTSIENLSQIFEDLNLCILAKTRIRLGRTSLLPNLIAILINLLLPTKLLNVVGNALFNRPIGTGLKAAVFWGNTFVVAKKL